MKKIIISAILLATALSISACSKTPGVQEPKFDSEAYERQNAAAAQAFRELKED